ncbi:methyltransferase-like protein 24 isoform X1 [Argonauta hians]
MKKICIKRKWFLRLTLVCGVVACILVYNLFTQRPSVAPVTSSFDIPLVWNPIKDDPEEPLPPPLPNILYINASKIYLSLDQSENDIEEKFFEFLIRKEIWCKRNERLGHQGAGGWNVCMSPPFGLTRPCIVYLIGTGDNSEFDKAVSHIYGCHVHVFNPLKKKQNQNTSQLIHVHNSGMSRPDASSPRGWKTMTFKKLLKQNGHLQTIISYVKIDIENEEWAALKTVFTDDSLTNVKQLAFEVHTVVPGTHQMIRPSKNRYMDMYKTLNLLLPLNFLKFDYRRNPFGEYLSPITKKHRSYAYELYYVNNKYANEDYDAQV